MIDDMRAFWLIVTSTLLCVGVCIITMMTVVETTPPHVCPVVEKLDACMTELENHVCKPYYKSHQPQEEDLIDGHLH